MTRRPEPSDHYGPMTEAELRQRVVKLAHDLGWMVFSRPMSQERRPVKDAIGYPDLTLARDGLVIWLELKVEKGFPSEDQLRWIRALPNAHLIRPSDVDVLVALLQ